MLCPGSMLRTRMFSGCLWALIALTLFGNAAVAANHTPSVTVNLNPSIPSPELLNSSITWTATVTGGQQGHIYDFQFSAALQGQNQMVRDFDLPNSFVWTPWQVEGNYVVSVVARDISTIPFTVYPPVSVQYVIRPIVTNNGQSAVNLTNHPLVALFSAGPCTVGHSMRVRFKQTGSAASMITNAVPCSSSSSNFLVAGMLASTQYQMQWEEFGANYLNDGPEQTFTTGPLPPNFPLAQHVTVTIPPSQHDSYFPVTLWHFLPEIGIPYVYWPTATDLSGNVIWYYPGQGIMTRMEQGGNFFKLSNVYLTEFDLAGRSTMQTNVNILNEQLTAKGYPILDSFNTHETRRLANGNVLVLGSRDVVSTQYQGGTQQDPVDIIGDEILVLDHNLQLLWAWDSFAHQDLSREATMHDLCFHNAGGCPPFNVHFATANDWLHSNAAQMTPDGNIIVSERSQDWVLKINYGNGSGDGHIMWRMGPYGDFTMTNPPQGCGDPNVFPWFTHQHDAAFQTQIGTAEIFTVFDDGNLRHQQCGGTGNSRGIVLTVSEPTLKVTALMEADLGQFSFALGSAQQLSSPSYPVFYSFGNGLLTLPAVAAQATETDAQGHIVFQLQATQWSYRTYRQQNLYTPTLP